MAATAACVRKHPHVCGEDVLQPSHPTSVLETPPRVWGRLANRTSALAELGNTPTCVGKTEVGGAGCRAFGKHPHVCGEDYYAACLLPRRPETPPRVWGRHINEARELAALRNTPTCVGKTVAESICDGFCQKHPHVCGEDGAVPVVVVVVVETPPRVWGRLIKREELQHELRNTPTCVGKTFMILGRDCGLGKHPHVCGEDPERLSGCGAGGETPPRVWGRPSLAGVDQAQIETPPRVWGRLRLQLARQSIPRNTPTCVGKTSGESEPLGQTEKHPHVCGEDRLGIRIPREVEETPPRVWGRPTEFRGESYIAGNTPTCVGKTGPPCGNITRMRKHPHVCGEDRHRRAACKPCLETPPRVWGRHHHRGSAPRSLRNTPTCVGKTDRKQKQDDSHGKHPHVCGEDFPRPAFALRTAETPPRVWGRRPARPLRKVRRGNTPTCVGKTHTIPAGPRAARKHPHVCGEDSLAAVVSAAAAETPPRVWGRQHRAIARQLLVGNTPTCVGKTRMVWRKPARLRKHPHVCGEDAPFRPPPRRDRETPPRVWGRRYPNRCTKKHPHVCGEDGWGGFSTVWKRETPPRVWGRHSHHRSPGCTQRNTPTCVGKTACLRVSVSHSQKHPHVCGEDVVGFKRAAGFIETPPRVWGRRPSHGGCAVA